jgi:nucleoside-diphosphate-sugar epimerase
MRYFVTGATGFIGGALTRELIKRGHAVVTIARNPAKAGDLVALGVTVHPGDITDKETMRAPMTGVDGVFHIAAWYKIGVREAHIAEDININGTRNVLELMRDLKIPKGVYTSTLAVYGDTHGKLADETTPKPSTFDTEYDRTKSVAHFDVALPMMKAGLPLVIVQPGMVYGPGDTSQMGEAWQQYLQRKLPMIPEGATYAWAHVDDIVEGHLLAMERGEAGESYIICGEPMKLIDAFRLAQRITDVPMPSIVLHAGLVKVMASIMEVVNKVFPLEGQMHPEQLRSLTASYIGANAKARRELGYNPRPLAEGLRQTLEYSMQKLGMKIRE